MKNLTGQRFGRLLVAVKNKDGTWICGCDCGKPVPSVPTSDLTSGRRKSCGCLRLAEPETNSNPAIRVIRVLLEEGTIEMNEHIAEIILSDLPKGKQKLARYLLLGEKGGR